MKIIHNITNYVTAGDVANAELAVGVSPTMTDSVKEVKEVTANADALNLNTGTLNKQKLSAMLISGRTANKKGIPVVLDMVGAGNTYRKKAILKLIKKIKFTVIKGNSSEFNSIIKNTSFCGVDATEETDINAVEKFAKRLSTVAIVTGKTDIITDGEKTVCIKNSTEMLKYITGAGCMLSGIIAAYLATEDTFEQIVKGVSAMAVSAQLAECDKIGDFKVRFFNELHSITDEKIKENILYEVKQGNVFGICSDK